MKPHCTQNTTPRTGDQDDARILVSRSRVADVYLVRPDGSEAVEFVVERPVAIACASLEDAAAFADPLVHCLLLAPGDVALVGRREPAQAQPDADEVAYVEAEGERRDEGAIVPGSLVFEQYDDLDDAWGAFADVAGLERPDDDEIVVRIVSALVVPPLASGCRDDPSTVKDAVDAVAAMPTGARRFDD